MRLHHVVPFAVAAAIVLSGVPAAAAQTVSQPLPQSRSAVAADDPVAPEAEVAEVDLVVPPADEVPDEPVPTAVPEPEDLVDPASEPVVADSAAEPGRIVTDAVDTSQVQTIGVTWPAGTDASALVPQVRTLDAGEWSQWHALESSDAAPDQGTADADRQQRDGTDPLWIGDAAAIQLSFAATDAGGPQDLRLALVGSPEVDAADVRTTETASRSVPGDGTTDGTVFATAAVTAAASAPRVISRGEWGARGQACAPDVASGLVGAVVHHTAGSNSYSSVAQAMQQIRNDQAYHIDGRRWCDLGYNFIVDKWGNIYEGRANSLSQPIIGVHAGGFNTGTVGVSMLGDYSNITPSAQTQDAVARIIGWRLGAYRLDPTGWMSYYTGAGENSKYANQWVNLPRVFGHRDVAYTACPGNGGYGTLGTVRSLAASYSSSQLFGESQAIVRKLYKDILGRDADPGGLQGWATAMTNGMSAAQVGTALATSHEYAFATVARDYQDVLGRGPDPEGLATWTDAIIRGVMRSEDLRIWLFGSVEYYNISGQTDAAYVQALYQDVLGRTAGAGDVDFWAPLVRSAGNDAVVRGFWRSMESANIRVEAFYQRYLGRSADPTGMATWPPVLLARGEGEMRNQIVGSLEYRNQSVDLYGG